MAPRQQGKGRPAISRPEDIMLAAQLAAALELSSWPKPGNVHRMADLGEKTYERFLAGSLAIGPACLKAATRGQAVGMGMMRLGDVGLGSLIEEAVRDDGGWQACGPTHMGYVLLCIPLAASAGLLLGEGAEVSIRSLREGFSLMLEAAGVQDAIGLYRALKLTASTKLGRLRPGAGLPDVLSERAEEELLERGLTLLDVLKLSSKWDLVAREACSSLRLCAEVGLPALRRGLEEHGLLNVAIVNTYLSLLAEAEDTHVARAWGLRETHLMPDAVLRGLEMAREVSKRAREALELGGAATEEGLRALNEMDRWLRGLGLNPGSCADLTACTLMLAILTGLRP
ncbi:MAG TPA: hypothetical protein ENF78_04570 [Candidatus Bathyarchaeota archaeon]|nr:hypothetical protein [Candidatus Bathyarchaeota archaeon]